MMEFFWRRLRRGERGFTLIELLIVVAIIAILAAVLIPNFLRSRGQSRVAASKGNMKNLGTALESYFVGEGAYPTAPPSALVTGQYIGALPKMPDGTTYEYKVKGDPPTSYAVCDWKTDVGVTTASVNTVWYYTPQGGLSSKVGTDPMVQTDCPGAP